jgi:uncharacterized protein
MEEQRFEWDLLKEQENLVKHGVSFREARFAFIDPHRVIDDDPVHSHIEERYYCYGLDEAGKGVLTVRFTLWSGKIRIIGAGYWRKGRKIYEQENQIH